MAGVGVSANAVDWGRSMHSLLRAGALAAVVVLSSNAVRYHRRPPDQVVLYNIYEDPANPQKSRAVFTVRLELAAVKSVGRAVGWEITEVRLRHPGETSETGTIWVESFPAIESPDGLWWSRHRNPKAPHLSEFTLPPRLTGVAHSQTPDEADLAYVLEGVRPVGPLRRSPFQITAILDYYFIKVGSSEPEAEGDDEPTGVDPVNSDPPLGRIALDRGKTDRNTANDLNRDLRAVGSIGDKSGAEEHNVARWVSEDANSSGVADK